MSAFRLEVRADVWGDYCDPLRWHPAVTGTLNQTGEPDDVASTFATAAEAASFVRDCIPDARSDEAGAWTVSRGEFVVARLRVVEVTP